MSLDTDDDDDAYRGRRVQQVTSRVRLTGVIRSCRAQGIEGTAKINGGINMMCECARRSRSLDTTARARNYTRGW
jgi:hypothetical protein